jgi:hypothetical protein
MMVLPEAERVGGDVKKGKAFNIERERKRERERERERGKERERERKQEGKSMIHMNKHIKINKEGMHREQQIYFH